jgi:hypothetical protein
MPTRSRAGQFSAMEAGHWPDAHRHVGRNAGWPAFFGEKSRLGHGPQLCDTPGASMALTLGTGLIETREPLKMPKLQSELDRALVELGWEKTYDDKDPPEADPEDEATQFELMATGEGVLGIQVSEARVVRDLARIVSERLETSFLVFTTSGSLFGRRNVQVTCRKFEVTRGDVEELPVMATHTAEVTDVEHNELRQAPNALRQRIQGANDSMLKAEGTDGFKVKRVLRYKRNLKKIKWSSPRLGRLMTQIEASEAFEVLHEGQQPIVKVLHAGATSMAYLKPEELEELEAAMSGRPDIEHRRKDAGDTADA